MFCYVVNTGNFCLLCNLVHSVPKGGKIVGLPITAF